MSTKPRNRREQIEQRSREWAAKHLEVGPLFDRFAKEKLAQGFKHYSASAVWHRIRWETPAGADGTAAFKLNNDYCPYFARKSMRTHPELRGFFRTRKLTSEDQPATDLPELGPEDFNGGVE